MTEQEHGWNREEDQRGWFTGCLTGHGAAGLILRPTGSWVSQRQQHDQIYGAGRPPWWLCGRQGYSGEDREDSEGRAAITCCPVKTLLSTTRKPGLRGDPSPRAAHPRPPSLETHRPDGEPQWTSQRDTPKANKSGELKLIPRSDFQRASPKELCLEGCRG